MLYKMLKEQQENPLRDDWIENIKSDIVDLELSNYEIDDLGKMTKAALKTLVKDKCKKKAFEYLIQEKNKKKKMKNLTHSTLKTQEYLETNLLNNKTKKLLFRIRNRMIQVGHNYGNKTECLLESDQQEHLISCLIIKAHNPYVLANSNNSQYSDTFSENIPKLKNITELFSSALRTREILLHKN